MQKNEIDYHLTPYTINSKLDVRPKMIKLLEENIGSKLLDIGLGNDFWGLTIKSKAKKANINK